MIRALAALLVSTMFATAAAAVPISTLGAANTLVTLNGVAPGTVMSTHTLSGIGAGQTLVGTDARPVSPQIIYGLSNTGPLSLVVDYDGEFETDRRINLITGGLRLTC